MRRVSMFSLQSLLILRRKTVSCVCALASLALPPAGVLADA